ncbi:hypothetical protein BJ508DRAFT_126117 [Ascobolus immersus RN42]|uniref:Uncharacterized protein n=1 Tax=Ascobolus immersus RN42 TaxID=1160509 RepID=A0A3N4I384_ASCIM|nr:hypothetical protein BJ508DRAFT_126117 [Ascobolus immersus RN42]
MQLHHHASKQRDGRRKSHHSTATAPPSLFNITTFLTTIAVAIPPAAAPTMSRNASQHRLIQDSLNYSSGWSHHPGSTPQSSTGVRERIRRAQRANSRRHSNPQPLAHGITFLRRPSIPLIGEPDTTTIYNSPVTTPKPTIPQKVYLHGFEGGCIPINIADNAAKPLSTKRHALFVDPMKPNPLYVGIPIDTGARKSVDGAVTTSASKVVQLQPRPAISIDMAAEGGGVSLKPIPATNNSVKVVEKKTILRRGTVLSANGEEKAVATTPTMKSQRLSFSTGNGVSIAVPVPTSTVNSPKTPIKSVSTPQPPPAVPLPPPGLPKGFGTALGLFKEGFDKEASAFGSIGRSKTIRKIPPGLRRPGDLFPFLTVDNANNLAENPILPGTGCDKVDKHHTHRFTKAFFPDFVCTPSLCGSNNAFAMIECKDNSPSPMLRNPVMLKTYSKW